jgi:hypothetical protein
MLAWGSLSCCLQLGLIWPGGGVSGGWGCRLVGAYVALESARNKLVAPLNHRPPERYERFFRALEQRARGEHRGPPGGLPSAEARTPEPRPWSWIGCSATNAESFGKLLVPPLDPWEAINILAT